VLPSQTLRQVRPHSVNAYRYTDINIELHVDTVIKDMYMYEHGSSRPVCVDACTHIQISFVFHGLCV
jgi:hypothetical protein